MQRFLNSPLKNCKFFLSLGAILLGATLSLSAENFRIRKLVPITFTNIDEKITVSSGINDALWITLPSDLTYVSGIELTLKVPEDIVTWRDSVAYMLYEKLDPIPSEKKKNYHGERVYLNTIPGNFTLTIYVPISSDFSIKDNPYSVKLPLSDNFKTSLAQNSKQTGIFLRFMMVMKGVPESLENSILEIAAKPVLKNKGSLTLSITPPSNEEKKYSVFIDDVPANDYSQKILTTGEHHLSIVSDSYRNELRTFRIEQAKNTSVSVKLRGIEPLIKLLCPRNTQVYLDGELVKVTNEAIVVTQGEHTVNFILGDYEIIKTVSAMNGRTYSVNLNIDATITEEN
ncbi:MAG: hypothetical protein IJ530_05770 [Treponema sp.]|uniref:hypothetical protein n=1 Tax=Treponema sp. TaxID=166 RepID=UPI0025EEA738|nr:hypothetical protein [Treponema sp.]MBQ8679254.1 hypothetical protein [Treponema sp.]